MKRRTIEGDPLLEAMRSGPASLLKAASTAAVKARRHSDSTALIAAGNHVQQAFHDLLAQATHLVHVEEDGFSVVLLAPDALRDLASAVSDAAAVSSIWVALGEQRPAAAI